MKLWLDDVLAPPDGWVHARSVNAGIALMSGTGVTVASLDHDLGDYASDGGDGVRLVDWMAEHDTWPSQGIRVHSANPVGAAAMLRTIDRYSPYPLGYGNTRGTP